MVHEYRSEFEEIIGLLEELNAGIVEVENSGNENTPSSMNPKAKPPKEKLI